MKKYLLSALALPLLFACSSEDYLDQKATDNDQFAGIEKVDATFSMADSPSMRMANIWQLEEGDQYGFAWLTDAYEGNGDPKVGITGNAFQNHPLTQTGDKFKPQTSIYVGKYFLYRPYDKSVVSPAEINFSLAEQNLANDASAKHNGAPYQALAARAIIIGDKWTDVKPDGTVIDEEIWNKPGIDNQFKIYAALFSNRTALDLTYKNNNPKFAAATPISGATDINFTIAKDETVGAADITKVTVDLQRTGASSTNNVFTYAPDAAGKEPVIADGVTGDDHDGDFWADKSNVSATYGFKFKAGTGVITLTPDAGKVETGEEGSKGWFWFNSLPVTNGDAALTDKVVTTYDTSYGTVTIDDKDGDDTEVTLQNVAYAREVPTTGTAKEWIKFAAADDETKATDQKEWEITAAAHNTFVNQYGNHAGKYAITVDFSKGVMDGMHITDDAHLQKALKYYIASGKTEHVSLNLDEDVNGEFKISKISIALLQTINKTTEYVKVHACATHGTPKIIVTQAGSEGKTEVPALNKVFDAATDVFLASATNWTWAGGADAKTELPIDAQVKSITNEGTLTVNATNVELSVAAATLANAAGATMNITKVTTVKNALTNLGTINVGAADNKTAELRAYGVEIKNDATSLTAHGVINNFGVIGSTSGTTGEVNNYGLIKMMNGDAMTLLRSNEIGTNTFANSFAAGNKMGTVVLPDNNPTAIVSVANADANGFIKYTWPATETTYVTPEGNVKYNTIVVSGDIKFTTPVSEIQYIEFKGVRKQVVNPGGIFTKLKGVIVDNEDHNASIIIEKDNKLNPSVGVFLGTGATVYKGGTFKINNNTITAAHTTNYLGTWSLDQIVVWGE